MKCTQDGFEKFKNFLWFFQIQIYSEFSLLFYGDQKKLKTINYHMFARKTLSDLQDWKIP